MTVASVATVITATLLLMTSGAALASSAPAYTTVTGTPTVTDANNAGKILTFSLTTNGNIPQNADSYLYGKVFGFAWLGNPMVTNGPMLFTAATIHAGSGVLDSTQNPNGWHVHTGTLSPTDQCNIPNSLGNYHLAVSSITDPTGGSVSINGNSMTVQLAERSSTVNPESFAHAATGFALQPNAGALCVVSPPDAS